MTNYYHKLILKIKTGRMAGIYKCFTTKNWNVFSGFYMKNQQKETQRRYTWISNFLQKYQTRIRQESCVFIQFWLHLMLSSVSFGHMHTTSVRLDREHLWTSILNFCRLFIRFRSGLWLGPPKTWVCLDLNHSPVALSVNCWRANHASPTKFFWSHQEVFFQDHPVLVSCEPIH